MSEEPQNTPEPQEQAAPTNEAAPTPEATPTPKAEKKAAKSEKSGEKAQPKAQQEEAAAPEKKEQPTAADLLKADIGDVTIRRAKGSKNITHGVVHILATFNNTKVTFTDQSGNVISWSSAGKMNFRGSRKSTAYAAQVVTQDAGRVAMSHGLKEVDVKLRGPGMGRDSAVRALQALGLSVLSIEDATPVPHNGCRAPKRRRV